MGSVTGGGLGSTVGGAAGTAIGGPVGGQIGSVVGGLLDDEGGARPYGNEPNYWNYPGYLPPGQRHKGYTGPSRANWQSGVWSPKGVAKPQATGPNGFVVTPPAPPPPGGLIDVQSEGIGALGVVVVFGAAYLIGKHL